MDTKIIQIKQGEEYMTLNVLLKLSGVIPTGGMAKWYLSENNVLVNGEFENRRGRKLYPGDKIIINSREYTIGKCL